MADEKTKVLLEDWGFGSLVEVFAENDVNEEALAALSKDDVKELIPKVGMRARFMVKLNDYQLQLCRGQVESGENFKVLASHSFAENVEQPIINENVEVEIFPELLVENSLIEECQPSITNEACTLKRRNESEESSTAKKFFSPIASLDLEMILNQSTSGKFVLAAYQNDKILSRKSRGLLTEVIIHHLFQNLHLCLSNSDFFELSNKIVELFPNEQRETYYVPPVKKIDSPQNKSGISKGKLVDKYRNTKKEVKKVGLHHTGLSSSTAEIAELAEVITDDVKNSKAWLQNSKEPWTKVLIHWQNTICLRKPSSTNAVTVQQFIMEWPVLKLSLGYTLIELDFEKTYPSATFSLFAKWENLVSDLSHLKQKTCLEKSAHELQGILSQHGLNNDCKHALQMMLLPYLVPPTSRVRGGKKHWKPSTQECQEGMIVHVKIPGEIEPFIQRKRNKMQDLKLTVQPFIIFQGNAFEDIEAVYVSVDKILYKVDSVLKAIDICFKSFHVLNAEYPPESEHLWLIVQHAVYNIATKWDKTIPIVTTTLDLYRTVKMLIFHMKVHHSKSRFGSFSCGQLGCARSFQNLRMFKKHLEKHHTSLKTAESQLPLQGSSSQSSHADFEMAVCPNSQILTENNDYCNIYTGIVTKNIEESAAQFVAKLYSNPALTRNVVQHVVDDVDILFGSGMYYLKTKLEEVLSGQPEETFTDVMSLIDSLQNPFKHLRTEYSRIKFFEESECLIKPQSFLIGEQFVTSNANAPVLTPKSCNGQYIPIKKVLKLFLGLPGVFEACLANLHSHSNQTETISNFLNAGLWQTRMKECPEKCIIPLHLYFDDFEVGNPLGSNAGKHKLGVVYYTVPALPTECLSALENIFLAMIFHSSDRSNFGNDSVFSILIDDLVDLERSGILVNTTDGEKTVQFCVALLVGDNLGLHSILGFVECFSATYYCRFCKVDKKTAQKQVQEDKNLIRNRENYNTDVIFCDSSKTGIKSNCIWNRLPSYHVTENVCVDVMHDLLEGVCRYNMAHIIRYLVSVGFFSISTLNNRIKLFDYGKSENCNKPPHINGDHLKNTHIIMSASEMLSLVRYFGLMVGDLVLDGDAVWDFYLCLREIVDIVTDHEVNRGTLVLLETLIVEHHTLFQQLFKEPLKPKHHFMLHYPRILESVGPLVNVWCMRYEARHRLFKISGRNICSRRNISYSLAIKNQLQLCFKFFSHKELNNTLTTVGPGNIISTCSLSHYDSFKDTLKPVFETSCYKTSWVIVKGIKYSGKCVLFIDVKDETPQFCMIEHIVVNENIVCFVVMVMKTVGWCSHIYAFQVELLNMWKCVDHNSLLHFTPTNLHRTADGKVFVCLKN